MPDAPTKVKRPRGLLPSAVSTLVRLLSERGLSAQDVERGMDYAEAEGAGTTYEGYVLAMSRVLFSDAQLAAGLRFSFGGTGHALHGEHAASIGS